MRGAELVACVMVADKYTVWVCGAALRATRRMALRTAHVIHMLGYVPCGCVPSRAAVNGAGGDGYDFGGGGLGDGGFFFGAAPPPFGAAGPFGSGDAAGGPFGAGGGGPFGVGGGGPFGVGGGGPFGDLFGAASPFGSLFSSFGMFGGGGGGGVFTGNPLADQVFNQVCMGWGVAGM